MTSANDLVKEAYQLEQARIKRPGRRRPGHKDVIDECSGPLKEGLPAQNLAAAGSVIRIKSMNVPVWGDDDPPTPASEHPGQ